MKLLAIALILTATSAAFAQSDETFETVDSASPQVEKMADKKPLASGQIVPADESVDEFEFTRNTKAVITTKVCKGTGEEMSCSRVNTHTVRGVRKFPINFAASSKYSDRCTEGTCYVDVQVLSDGDEFGSGDLETDESIALPSIPAENLSLEVWLVLEDEMSEPCE